VLVNPNQKNQRNEVQMWEKSADSCFEKLLEQLLQKRQESQLWLLSFLALLQWRRFPKWYRNSCLRFFLTFVLHYVDFSDLGLANIIGNCVTGPYTLPDTQTSHACLLSPNIIHWFRLIGRHIPVALKR